MTKTNTLASLGTDILMSMTRRYFFQKNSLTFEFSHVMHVTKAYVKALTERETRNLCR
jgi:hypothetical protein